MKILCIGLLNFRNDPVDVGAVVVDGEDFSVLGYMGTIVEIPGLERPETQSDLEERFPKVAQAMSLIPAVSLSAADDDVLQFVSRYLNEDEPFRIITHEKIHDLVSLLPKTTGAATSFYNMHWVEPFFDIFGVDSEYLHDAEALKSLDSDRAVSRAMFAHAELLVYYNNIVGWAVTCTDF